MVASDSENAIHDAEADLLESVYVYLTEGKYQERGVGKSKEGNTKESSKL